MDSSNEKLQISSCSVQSIRLIVIVLLLNVLHKLLGVLLLHDKTAFVCQLVKKNTWREIYVVN